MFYYKQIYVNMHVSLSYVIKRALLLVGPLRLLLMAYYGSYLKDVLPGSIYVSFGGETSHDHCMKLRKLK